MSAISINAKWFLSAISVAENPLLGNSLRRICDGMCDGAEDGPERVMSALRECDLAGLAHLVRNEVVITDRGRAVREEFHETLNIRPVAQ